MTTKEITSLKDLFGKQISRENAINQLKKSPKAYEKFCMKFNTSIVVVNNEELSPQEELVQDIVSILHEFSCRLYGLRKYKKK